MNTYRYTFAADCPNNGESIIYALAIETERMIHVEHIKTACLLHTEAYHEDIAADLHARFGGRLTLKANHHGVDVETILDSAKATTPQGAADHGR